MKKEITISRLLDEGIAALKKHRCARNDAARDAELLLTKTTGLEREVFLTHPERPMNAARARTYRNLIRRRLNHEPMAYLLGTAWFYGREFWVNSDTLIPRPATESLVAAAVAALKETASPFIVDIGTGSGAIAVTLAAELPRARVLATDVSAAALTIARKNARRHVADARITFKKTDLLPRRATAPLRPRASAILANLPYLPTGRLRHLPPDIRLHEPGVALDGGHDGLNYYRQLIKSIASQPQPPAFLFLEILSDQYRPLASFIRRHLPSAVCEKITNPAGVCVGLAAKIPDGA